MEEQRLVPKRRFEGFGESWRSRKLGEVLELNNGYSFQSKYFQDKETGKVVLTPGNVEIGGGFQVGKGHNYNKSAKIPQNFFLKPGDMFVTMTDLTPSAQTLGYPAVVPNDGNVYLHNQRLGKLVNYNGNKDFLFQSLCTKLYHQQIIMTASGTTVKHSSPEKILECVISIPCKKEQQKIGEFFKILDERIANQERKIAKVKALKSAYLTEMFPQEGKTVPKRRFKGFEETWYECKFLNQIESIIDFRGRTPKKLGSDWSEDGYLALSALNVKNGHIDFTIDAHYGNQELYNRWMSGKELRKGQVLFTTEAPMGNVAQVPDNRGYILSQRTIAFVTNRGNLTDDFLSVLLRSSKVYKRLLSLSSGGTAQGVSQKTLEELKVTIPKNIKEQQKIGQFFKNLDDQIATEEFKLEKLKKMKEAYLEEMFV